jgi:hypothetical protein
MVQTIMTVLPRRLINIEPLTFPAIRPAWNCPLRVGPILSTYSWVKRLPSIIVE